jgi:hypothetical protein
MELTFNKVGLISAQRRTNVTISVGLWPSIVSRWERYSLNQKLLLQLICICLLLIYFSLLPVDYMLLLDFRKSQFWYRLIREPRQGLLQDERQHH